MCCDPVSSPHIGPKESPEEATWAQFADADSDEIYADAGDAKSFYDKIYADAGANFDAFEADDFDS